MKVAAETLVDAVPDSLSADLPKWTQIESGYMRFLASPRDRNPVHSLKLTVRLVTVGDMFGRWRWKVSMVTAGESVVDEGYETSRDEAMRWAIHRGRAFWS